MTENHAATTEKMSSTRSSDRLEVEEKIARNKHPQGDRRASPREQGIAERAGTGQTHDIGRWAGGNNRRVSHPQ